MILRCLRLCFSTFCMCRGFLSDADKSLKTVRNLEAGFRSRVHNLTFLYQKVHLIPSHFCCDVFIFNVKFESLFRPHYHYHYHCHFHFDGHFHLRFHSTFISIIFSILRTSFLPAVLIINCSNSDPSFNFEYYFVYHFYFYFNSFLKLAITGTSMKLTTLASWWILPKPSLRTCLTIKHESRLSSYSVQVLFSLHVETVVVYITKNHGNIRAVVIFL